MMPADLRPPYRIPAALFYPSQSEMFHQLIHLGAKQGNKGGLSTAWQSAKLELS